MSLCPGRGITGFLTVVRMREGDVSDDGPRDTDSAAAARVTRARALVEDAKRAASTLEERRATERARDVALVAAAKGGDARSFQSLVVAHQARLFSVAYGMLRDRDEAMDVVQDAFIKAYRKLPEFEGTAAFSTWLYRIAVNLCIDRKRAEARRRKTDLDDAATRNLDDDPLYAEAEYAPRMSGHNPLRNTADKQLGAQIGQAMAQLSEDHRAIVLLREVEGMSYEEIALTLGVPKGTVMSRLFHARKNLQRVLRPLLGLAEGIGPSGRPLGDTGSVAGADLDDGRQNEESASSRRLVPKAPGGANPGD
jgi:RNA polymerase sigma-70 factor (ECF subfamily)